ncbi:MAG: 50S ribosomal protein L10 [Nitrospiraceae bacterium]|nr:MAG: 50S ribosomal protein L10 [Nitrospiraceae bacterium]
MDNLNRTEKAQVVSELQKKFESAKGIVFTDYRGLNVEEITELRNSLRESALEYRVVKNTLARIAAEGTPVDQAKDILSGPIGIAVGFDDPVLVVKKVLEFNKSNDKLEVRGGIVEGNVYALNDLLSISKLPPKEIQLSMLAGVMKAPATKLAGLLSATLTRFAYAMEALKDKKNKT